jgi:hypothetical protein
MTGKFDIGVRTLLRQHSGSPKYIRLIRSIIYDGNDLEAWPTAHRRCSTFEYDSEGGVSCTR